MKYFIVSVFFMCSLIASADTNLAQITIKNGSINHKYAIHNDKESFSLMFQQNGKIKNVKKIESQFANELIAEISRISWKADNRKLAQAKCTEYATILLGNERPIIICQENRVATGQSYGILNRLRAIIK